MNQVVNILYNQFDRYIVATYRKSRMVNNMFDREDKQKQKQNHASLFVMAMFQVHDSWPI